MASNTTNRTSRKAWNIATDYPEFRMSIWYKGDPLYNIEYVDQKQYPLTNNLGRWIKLTANR